MIAALKVDACRDSHDYLFEHGTETLPMDLGCKDYEFDEVKPIAVIGFSFKFPQEATSAESFTSLLREGKCAVTEFPKDRINIDAFYSTDANRNDTFAFRGGHFLCDDIGAFDAPFFSISPAEADSMDPQQRGLLETCYRALENAGIPLKEAKGSKTSVHTGNFSSDWAALQLKDPQNASKYAGTGMAHSLLANRISWFFDFKGPSFALDSACSSSMMALDLACQGLQTGQSTMGLVAGCNLIYDLQTMSSLANMGFLSRDSRCFSFDERANGYGRGEGFGVIVLKLLATALKDGDSIRAIIRSTASNQDGRTTAGITVPNSSAQEQLINEAYAKAGLDKQVTGYVEAHGTGTPIGDPAEVSAIEAAFMKDRSSDKSVYVGSVKSNIGHLEGASGVAGIIKTILMLEKGLVFPIADLKTLNPDIERMSPGLLFPRKCVPWPHDGLRRVSVNSFGMGGANCHAVLDDAYNFLRLRNIEGHHNTVQRPSFSSKAYRDVSGKSHVLHHEPRVEKFPRPRLLVWSAADERGIKRLGEVYSKHYAELDISGEDMDTHMDNLAFTLAIRRSSLPWKSFMLADSIHSLQWLHRHLSKPVRSTREPCLGFIFTGQGAQWWGMGRELVTFPVFRDSLQKSEQYLQVLGCPWLLFDELFTATSESQINEPTQSQTLCSALQIALVDLLRSFGVTAKAVVGHSSGEIAAAYCTGAISHRSAVTLAYHRGLLAAKLSKSGRHAGAMVSVSLSELEVQPYIDEVTSRFDKHGLNVGCINSPNNVTITGLRTQVDALTLLLEKTSISVRKLRVNVAYHSTEMEVIADEYQSLIKDIEAGILTEEPPIMISSLTGSQVSTEDLSSHEYWSKNMLSPVQFSKALSRLCSDGIYDSADCGSIDTLIEIGPHAALKGPVREVLRAENKASQISYNSVLVRNKSAVETTLYAIGLLHCSGCTAINLGEVNQSGSNIKDRPMTLTNLPEYPFDHSRVYWHESRLSKDYRLRKNPRLDLLGTPSSDRNPLDARWRNILRVSELPWTEEHEISGAVIYPAAGMLVMAIEAANQMADEKRKASGYRIKEVEFKAPIPISLNSEGPETRFSLRSAKLASSQDESWSEFRLCSLLDGGWIENCCGFIKVEYSEIGNPGEPDDEEHKPARSHEHSCDIFPQASWKSIDSQDMYQYLRMCGHNYGPTFQCLQSIATDSISDATANLKLFNWSTDESENPRQSHIIHPVSLDGVFQIAVVAMSQEGAERIPTMVPRRLQNMWISSSKLSYPSTEVIRLHSRLVIGEHRREASICGSDSTDGSPLILIEGLETSVIAKVDSIPPKEKRLCYNLDWKPDVDLLDPEQILKYCQAGSPHLAEPIEFYQDLRFLLFSYISESLMAVRENQPITLAPHLQNYVKWMQVQVDRYDTGDLPCSQSNWKTMLRDDAYKDRLASRVEQACKEGKFFVEVGRNLTGVIQGAVDPLELMFEGSLARDYYQDVAAKVRYNYPISRYFDALAHSNPGMRIIEVGAGTGTMTSHVMQVLNSHGDEELGTPRYTEYDFTDISPSFFAAAQDTFTDQHERLKFKVLDIENDPVNQGFEAEAYDLVIAASVLHATQNLDKTVSNVRKLLKAGGKLMLLEVTKPDKLGTGFAMGLLPGWWLGVGEGRKLSPCVSEMEWNNIFSRNGFSKAETVFQDYQNEWCQETSFMICTALDSSDIRPSPSDLLVIADDHSPFQNEIADSLQKRLTLATGWRCGILPLRDVSKRANLQDAFCISVLELGVPFLRDLEIEAYSNLQTLLTTAQHLLWVSGNERDRDPLGIGMAEGLGRVLRTENPSHTFVTLSLRSSADPGASTQYEHCIAKTLVATVRRRKNGLYERDYVEENGVIKLGRIVEARYLDHHLSFQQLPCQSQVLPFGFGQPLVLSVANPGLLDSLHFRADKELSEDLALNEVEVEVRAVGLNFIDLLTALGRLERKNMGTECAGVVVRVGEQADFQIGDRVMLAYVNTFRTFVRCPSECAVKIPESLPFLEAAALPTTLTTAYHALIDTANLQKGESVLIHSAAGGTGQSAIQIAQYLGAEIYVTVGNDAKKQFVIERYGIPESHIFSSRNTSFGKDIKRMRKGRGIDVILNSLSGERLIASWECTAPFGRFIEIGKNDILAHNKISLFPFARNVTFSAVDMAAMALERPKHVQKLLRDVMTLVEAGRLRASQPLQSYRLSELEQAFRHMQTGKSMGKLVVEMLKEDKVSMILDTKPSFVFDPQATYLIAGGLGGIGLSISRWMASRGAKNLLLLSRSGILKKEASEIKLELRQKGVRVETPACDVTDMSSLAAILEEYAQMMPPIKGCIQSSVVLKDSIFNKMPFDVWKMGVDPKVRGSLNLHHLLPKNLDFFVLLSSVSGILGKETQANYAAANSYMDALARYRVSIGEKAVSIDLGIMEEIGRLASFPDMMAKMKAPGTLIPLFPKDLEALLDYFCNPSLEFLSPLKSQVVVGIETPANMTSRGHELPVWMSSPMFRHLFQIDGTDTGIVKSQEVVDIAASFRSMVSLSEAAAFVADLTVDKLAKSMSMAKEDMQIHKPMRLFGMDSLLAVELRNWFAKKLKADITVFDLMGEATFAEIGLLAAKRSAYKQGSWAD